MTEAMLMKLITPRRGPMLTHLPSRYARTNVALIAYVKAKGK